VLESGWVSDEVESADVIENERESENASEGRVKARNPTSMETG